ncbi:MAG: hypothetical protein JWQ33_1270 [Ramlibacter sp.]|nr:hypothetical protein [Ramlibacter sp.]
MGPYVINDLKLLHSLPGADAVVPAADKAFGVQCVGLVKTYSKAGGTFSWTAGDQVMSTPALKPGTAIATFNAKGRYESHSHGNHACFFIRFTGDGFLVLEQHVQPNRNKIQSRLVRSRGTDKSVSASDNADAYAVIK